MKDKKKTETKKETVVANNADYQSLMKKALSTPRPKDGQIKAKKAK